MHYLENAGFEDSGTVFISETRLARLFRTGGATPRFLQGVYPFVGRGLFEPEPLHADLIYTVPADTTAEVLYVRAGNAAQDLVYVALLADGEPIRYLPVGPKSDIHVPLAIVDPHPAGQVLTVGFAAPRGLSGTIILDIGIAEVHANAVDGSSR